MTFWIVQFVTMFRCIRFFVLVIPLLFASARSVGQSSGFMYADVVLKKGETVSGIIKWYDGQMLWTDVLTVSKNNTFLLKYLNKRQLDELSERRNEKSLDWQFMNLWKDKLPERQPEVLCRFGDISSIHVTGATDVQIYYKNNTKIRANVNGTDGDPVKSIEVYGASVQKIPWNQISRINFKPTDYSSVTWKRTPLYGTVYTMAGPMTGYICWDQSKFVSSRTLYGKNNDVITGIKFWDIKKIAKKDKGAIVTFNSGKQVFLQDTRDVSALSRGIAVSNPEWGRAVIEWSGFKSVVFNAPPDDAGYATFAVPKRIYATIRTAQGNIFKGNCTFDLDEEWNFELLEGSSNRIHYQIPFLMVSSLQRLNENQSRVQLKNGRSLLLNRHNDISGQNWGLITWLANSKYQYLPWEDVTEIKFR